MREEKDIKKYFENVSIPKELDFAIEKALNKAKRKKKDKNIIKIMSSIVAVLVLTFTFVIYRGIERDGNKVPHNPSDNAEITVKSLNLPTVDTKENLLSLMKSDYDNGRKDLKEYFNTKDGAIENRSSSHSRTNNQVEGVEESDIVKTDGKYIYMIREKNNNEKELVIIESYPSEDMKVISNIPLGNNINNESIQIVKDKIVIMYNDINEGRSSIDMNMGCGMSQNVRPESKVIIYDKSDINNLNLIREISYEGSIVNNRLIEDNLYVVTEKFPYDNLVICGDMEGLKASDLTTPIIKDSLNEEEKVDLKDIKYCPGVPMESFITISCINLNKVSEKIISNTILASSNEMYVSEKNMYISGFDYKDKKTLIFKFTLNEGDVNLVARGEVEGKILNQFSMDEYKDNFRIATTNVGRANAENNIYILDKDLKVVGSLTGLAKGEKIYSSRFIGDKAYVVTFKEVDPLFVIDLSDDKNPKVLGELKIPGFSTYLHPYDDDTLIGIGQNTIEVKHKGVNSVRTNGIKISMFDISDFNNPKEIHKEIIEGRSTYSEALSNHKALLFSKEKQLIAFPIMEDNEDPKYNGIFSGAYVYNISKDNGFELKEKIKSEGYDYNKENNQELAIRRLIIIEDHIYSISNEYIKVNKLKDMSLSNKLKF